MADTPITLGPFELLAPIGKGGMAVVWSARHQTSGMPAAVKIIRGPHSQDPDFCLSFRKEVRAMAALRHPNIVTILDQGAITQAQAEASKGRLKVNSPYFVMELLEGGTLRHHTPLKDWAQLKGILRTLLLALAHAHARGLVHLDLKPDNVLLVGPDNLLKGAKLTDFGIAQAVADPDLLKQDDDEGVAIGTPLYMAPEQCLGRWRQFGPWTDLYAFGCMTFELATGMPPYPRRTRTEALVAHLEAPRPKLTTNFALPPGFTNWLGQLLERNPARRYRRAADALWALEGLGAAEGNAPTVGLYIPPAPERLPGEDTPPMPQVFGQEQEAEADPILLGAGLGLFGLRHPTMVGREVERKVIWEALRRTVREKSPRAVVIRGPSGVGKSRIAQWIAERAHEWGVATVLRAEHPKSGDQKQGLAPMLMRVFPCQGLSQPNAVEIIRQCLPALKPNERGLVDALATYLVPGSPESKKHSRPVLNGTLEVLSRERPVIMVLDDAQWGAQARSLAIGLQAERSLLNAPILTLLTIQDEALLGDKEAKQHLHDLMALPGVETLHVGPLPQGDHAHLVRQILGLDGALTDDIIRRTEGHPLFAIQLVEDWVKRGLLEVKKGAFTLKPGAKTTVPERLHRQWSQHLEQLLHSRQAVSRRALEMAAILGQYVNKVEWRDACAAQGFLPKPDLLNEAISHGFILKDRTDPEEKTFYFVHEMLRESLEQSAQENKRWVHHQRAATFMLTRRYLKAPERYASRLARHRLALEDYEGSLEPLVKAATVKYNEGKYPQAHKLLALRSQALERAELPKMDPRRGQAFALEIHTLLALAQQHKAFQLSQHAAKTAAYFGWQKHLPGILEAMAKTLQKRGENKAAQAVLRRAETLRQQA